MYILKKTIESGFSRYKRLSVLTLRLMFLLAIVLNHAGARADVVRTAEDQLRQNVENVKNNIKELKEEISQIDGLTNEATELKNNLVNELDKAMQDPTGYDSDKLDEILKKAEKNDAFSKLGSKLKETVNSIKNIATVIYTAPVGLQGGYGQTGLTITMDTLKNIRQGADKGNISITMDAAFQLPFSVSDGGDNAQIEFEGNAELLGMNTTKLMVKKMLQENIDGFVFKKDILSGRASIAIKDESYVEVDCNGFRGMYLKGEFRFSPGMIYNAETKGTDSGDSMVTAAFAVNITDLEDIVIMAELTKPFKIKCTGDVVYEVRGVVADLSTLNNAEDFQFPRGYRNPFKGGDENYWTGIAFKTIKVNPNEEIPMADGVEITAYNMLIDDSGISGWFGMGFGSDKGKFPDSPVLAAKIDSIAIGIASNKVAGGALTGSLTAKMLKEKENDKELNLSLNGTFYSDSNDNLCYAIETKVDENKTYNIPFLNNGSSTITIGAGTSVAYRKVEKTSITEGEDKYERGFFFNINGELNLSCSFMKVAELRFQDLMFSTCKPYFGGGKFALNSARSLNLGGLEIGLNNMVVGLTVNENEEDNGEKKKMTYATLAAGVSLKLIGDGKGLSVAAGFRCEAKKSNGGDWVKTGLMIDSIKVDADFSAFHLNGMIAQYGQDKNDLTERDTFGRGFKGYLRLKLDMLSIDVRADAQFGKTKFKMKNNEEFRYWYAEATVSGLKGVVIFPPAIMLEGVSLGLFSHMNYTINQTSKVIERKYYPDKGMKFGIQGGIQVFVAQESLVGAQVKLGLDINSSGGIKNVNLEGGIYLLGKDVNNALVTGTVRMNYDFENKIFSTSGLAEFGVSYLKGSVSFDMFSSRDEWHFYVGTNKNPCYLKFAKIINAQSYFMLGHGVPSTLRPLDPRVTEIFGISKSTASGKSEEMKSGKGFAFGTAIDVDCGFRGFIYASVTVLGGIDVLVLRNPGMNCENNSYRGYEIAYVYLDLSSGIRARKKKFEFLEISAGSELEAQFPKPLYFDGKIEFRYRVLGGLIRGRAKTRFSAGKTCTPEKNYTDPYAADYNGGQGLNVEPGLTIMEGNLIKDLQEDETETETEDNNTESTN